MKKNLKMILVLTLVVYCGGGIIKDNKPADAMGITFNSLYVSVLPIDSGVKLINFEQLNLLKQAGGSFVLVDVLSRESYDSQHIEGALSLPIYSITEKSAKDVIGSNKNIIVYCANYRCNASTMAAKKLEKLGYKVLDYKGGLADYKKEGGQVIEF